MDPASLMDSFGIELPSPAYLFGALVFGLIGYAAFRLGRRGGKPLTVGLGVALMLFPYVVTRTAWMFAVGLALCAGLWFDRG